MSNLDQIRSCLDPFIRATGNPVDFNRESLFEGRDALKQVFDLIDHRHQRALAEGFGAVQALVGGMIRRGHVEQGVVLKAIHTLMSTLVELAGSQPIAGPQAEFEIKAPSGHGPLPGLSGLSPLPPAPTPGMRSAAPSAPAAPSASGYLRLGGQPGKLELAGRPGAPVEPVSPKGEHTLGQLLVQSGKISSSQLTRALDLQKINGRRLGEVLIAMEAIGIQTLEEALNRQQVLQSFKGGNKGTGAA
ncbi:MAG: hypothetical protein R3F17_12020 [Planctomycetota bacterium]